VLYSCPDYSGNYFSGKPYFCVYTAIKLPYGVYISKGDTQMTRQEMQRLSIAELRKLAQDAAGHIIGERAEDVLREVTAPTRIKLHGRIGGFQ
jgi:hypothetical protein